MIPIGDSEPTRGTAWLVVILIAINCLVFLRFSATAGNPEAYATYYRAALVADHILHPARPNITDIKVPERGLVFGRPVVVARTYAVPSLEPVYVTFITSIFMHGSWAHLIGNMLFLWIFGNNIEDRLGKLGFLGFYLLCGVLAGVAQIASEPSSKVPLVGASGAIAGVLGGYMILFPGATIRTLVWTVVLFTVEIPAIIYLGMWFVLQVWSAGGAAAQQGGGVAWWAHIGGFLAGLALIKAFEQAFGKRGGWRRAYWR